MNITLRRTLMVCVLAGVLALALALATRDASAAPPEPVTFPPDTLTGYCDFPVLYEVSGKTKVIDLPNGDVLFKNPSSRVTLTNLEDPTHQLTYVSTGTVRLTELENGELLLVTTGRTVLTNENLGILVPIGRFTFTIDEDGNFSRPTGHGRLIDVCARLA